MADYFEKFPIVDYVVPGLNQTVRIRDITRRVKFLEDISQNAYTFLPYTIDDGMTAEDIAYHYYGDPRYVWLVHLSIGTKDPYYDFPVSDKILNDMIIKKYGAMANEMSPTPLVGLEILHWTSRIDIEDNIKYYRRSDDHSETITKDTYLTLSHEDTNWLSVPAFEAEGWEVLRFHEYEIEKNESLRNIFLINKDYRDQVETELKKFISNE